MVSLRVTQGGSHPAIAQLPLFAQSGHLCLSVIGFLNYYYLELFTVMSIHPIRRDKVDKMLGIHAFVFERFH